MRFTTKTLYTGTLGASLLLGTLLSPDAAALVRDPFARTAPTQSLPVLLPLPGAPETPGSAAEAAQGGSTSPLPNLGAPRVSSEGAQTRVVYDLPPGASYSLSPGNGGLKLEFQGARATPSVTAQLGGSVGEYRVATSPGGVTLTLVTPFALGVTTGWRASETTIASGGRVLILDFGPATIGGATSSIRGAVQLSGVQPGGAQTGVAPTDDAPEASAPAPQNEFSMQPTSGFSLGGLNSGNDPAGLSAPGTAPVTQGRPVSPDQLAPGDSASSQGGALPAPASTLPGQTGNELNALSGKASGAAQSGASLGAPRIGKSPGVTRIVLDIPPGASFQITPGALGLAIEIQGVGASNTINGAVSTELRGWRYAASGNRTSVFLQSASALTRRSGWRGVLLPPPGGSDRSRLAIDLSPAFADTTVLGAAERVLGAVPPVRSGALTFTGSPALVAPTVVIDPGHGGRDGGAQGIVSEKVVTLDVALRVRQYLQNAGVNVIMSRDTDRSLYADKATDLDARAALGYSGARLFVSIHANSMEPVNVLRGYGVETWWNRNNPASSTFASLLQNNVVQTTGAYNQGLKSSRSLAVLRGSRVPAALVEIGFVGHPIDGTNLFDNNYLERVALGIARGIREALVTGVGQK
jgi:N-acetylmuramoyl-L-alanine amidase